MARAKGLYNALAESDLAAYLSAGDVSKTRRFDLVLATDVLVYIGELDALFMQIAARMHGGALFAFSTQALDQAEKRPYLLGKDHRYAHNQAYLHVCAETAGLAIRSCTSHVIRQDGGQDLIGFIVLAEKPSAPLIESDLPAMDTPTPRGQGTRRIKH